MNPFFLLLASFLLKTVGSCHVHQKIIDHGTIYDLPVEEDCEHHFHIHPHKSINLRLPCDSRYSLWMTVEETKDRIFHSNATPDCSRTEERFFTFQAPLNVGLTVISEQAVVIKVWITDRKNVCAYPYIKLTSNETRVIQEDLTFDNLQECVYRIIPGNDNFNSVNITFGSLDNLNYEQRIGKNVNVYNTSKVFELVDSFDIKINPYVEIPEIKVQFTNNECIKTHYFQMADIFLSFEPTWKPDDGHCTGTYKTIIKVDFKNLKYDEVIFMQHNVDKENLRITDGEKVIMDETHWLRNAALNFSTLQIQLTNVWKYQMNFTRIQIQKGCECPSYGSLVSTTSSSLSKNFMECPNIFCHIRLENPKSAVFNLHTFANHLPITLEPPSDYFSLLKHGDYFEEDCESRDYSLREDYFEIAFIRLNQTYFGHTYVHFSWSFSRNAECAEDETRIVTQESPIILTSINYPLTYPPNLDCRTLVKTEQNSTLSFEIIHFAVDSDGDILEIYNGDTTDSKYLIKNFTGHIAKNPGSTFESGSQALLLFQTNDKTLPEIDQGYRIKVTAKPLYSTTSTTSATTTISSTKNPPSSSPPPSSSSNENPSSSSSHIFLYIFIILLIAAAGAGYFYQEKIKQLLSRFNFPLNNTPTTLQNVNFS